MINKDSTVREVVDYLHNTLAFVLLSPLAVIVLLVLKAVGAK